MFPGNLENSKAQPLWGGKAVSPQLPDTTLRTAIKPCGQIDLWPQKFCPSPTTSTGPPLPRPRWSTVHPASWSPFCKPQRHNPRKEFPQGSWSRNCRELAWRMQNADPESRVPVLLRNLPALIGIHILSPPILLLRTSSIYLVRERFG